MATAAKPQQAGNPAPRPAAQPKPKASVKNEKAIGDFTLLFDKENYMWGLAAVALLFIGYFMMSGGKSANPHEFHYDEIYSVRRITLAPLTIMLGYIVAIYAIMKRPKETPKL